MFKKIRNKSVVSGYLVFKLPDIKIQLDKIDSIMYNRFTSSIISNNKLGMNVI